MHPTMTWTLYTAPGTCALATHIALLEAGANFEVVTLNFAQQQNQGAEYLAINPKGRVPALRTPEGTLTETPALLLFIAQRFPQAALAPLDDPFALARLQEFNSYLASTVHVAHAHRRRGARWADDAAAQEAMRAKVPQNMTACAAVLEAQLATGTWVLGERYSVADGYLFALTGWMEGDGVDLKLFPRLTAHHARVAARPATQRALAGWGSAMPASASP
jgi:glutathione S-transferase